MLQRASNIGIVLVSVVLLACNATPSSSPSPFESSTSGSVCPPDMLVIPAGTYLLGETDPAVLSAFNVPLQKGAFWSVVIPRQSLPIARPFCIEKYPGHGRPGRPWVSDGLSYQDMGGLERALAPAGRRVCTATELLVASAAPDNHRYPYGNTPAVGICDTDPDHPQKPMGSFSRCLSGLGLADFQVRASWCRIDPADRTLLAASGVDLSSVSMLEYAVCGGNARYGEAFHASSNFAVHGHPGTTPKYADDDVRFCRNSGPVDSRQEAIWQQLSGRWADSGQYGSF